MLQYLLAFHILQREAEILPRFDAPIFQIKSFPTAGDNDISQITTNS